MTDDAAERLTIEALPDYEPEIGRVLGALDETRQRTLAGLDGVSDNELNWTPAPGFNSIATILYHLAAIEADWLYTEVLQQPFPPEAEILFPSDVRDDQGRLSVARDVAFEPLTARLDAVRVLLLSAFRDMTSEDFRRERRLLDYDVTPEYVLHHLMQHEAEHRGEIGMLRALAARREATEPR